MYPLNTFVERQPDETYISLLDAPDASTDHHPHEWLSKLLFFLGFLCPILWILNSALYLNDADLHVSRWAGKSFAVCVYLSAVLLVLVVVFMAVSTTLTVLLA